MEQLVGDEEMGRSSLGDNDRCREGYHYNESLDSCVCDDEVELSVSEKGASLKGRGILGIIAVSIVAIIAILIFLFI